jgi:hypothetical protein
MYRLSDASVQDCRRALRIVMVTDTLTLNNRDVISRSPKSPVAFHPVTSGTARRPSPRPPAGAWATQSARGRCTRQGVVNPAPTRRGCQNCMALAPRRRKFRALRTARSARGVLLAYCVPAQPDAGAFRGGGASGRCAPRRQPLRRWWDRPSARYARQPVPARARSTPAETLRALRRWLDQSALRQPSTRLARARSAPAEILQALRPARPRGGGLLA